MGDKAGGVMHIKNELGFAMLEVLVSLLIILFGVLGIAGMQMLVINNTETARYQSVATMLASSMTAEIQANFTYWGGVLVPPATITVTGATITGIPSSAGTSCLNSDCTATQLAYYDLQNWGTAMAGVANVDLVVNNGMALPPPAAGPSGVISCAATTPVVCTLTMYWSEKNLALSNATGAESGVLATGTAQTHSYQTLVSIQL
jgi:type IV pilus assembly protein PilV